ncbi:hypothetical protein GRI39_08830 [Altererythrobacter indicus]|uniref:Flp pilus-assembly TadG-like N-terminal domain-containing protein n=1 Tax=Altericroceibacterium indicum TaxID=374177 RepID=A0A845A9W5_9SPHN|nr:pilus assembly protein TadG-related protein [Altericroceibacterium indicum]MXP26139.1 hypothetical protein [Altericroceibacterium indicum]
MNIFRALRHLSGDFQGNVMIIAALSLPVVIGSAGLAVDLNRGYEQRVFNQRAADMGALAAAMAYKAKAEAGILTPTAQNMALANGLTGANVAASLVKNFPEEGDESVRVVVTKPVPYMLARVLGFSGNYNVSAESYAILFSDDPYSAPCYLALSDGAAAITVTGGASIDAPDCAVAAVGSIDNKGELIRGNDIISGEGDITVGYGKLEAETLRYGGSFKAPDWNSNIPPEDKRINQTTVLTDPWAENAELASAFSKLGTTAAMPSFGDPTTPNGSNWDFSWNPSNAVKAYRVGTTGDYVVPAGNYTIGKLTVAGGINVRFENGSNITIANGFDHDGSSFNFGNANLYVNGGFDTGYSGVTIGDGALWIGSGKVIFAGTNTKGNGNVIINDDLKLGGGQHLRMGNGSHYFGMVDLGGGGTAGLGSGDFVARKGVQVGGDSELAIGNGNVVLGKVANGNAVQLQGSGAFLMGDGTFSADGTISTDGGSKIAFGKTANHYINGDMSIKGGALFGAGRYTVNGDVSNGTGGATWPYTSKVNGKTYGQMLEGVNVAGFDMAGVNVSFILQGALNLSGGARTKLLAATESVSGAQIGEMLLASMTTNHVTWSGGSSNVFGGVIYFPKAEIKLSGGNATVDNGQCFSLVGDKISVTGGAATGSACKSMLGNAGSGSSGDIRLVR